MLQLSDILHSKFIAIKNCGGLIFPAKDVCVCVEWQKRNTEVAFLLINYHRSKYCKLLKLALCIEWWTWTLWRVMNIFSHVGFSEESHYSLLIKTIVNTYFEVRMNFIAREQSLDTKRQTCPSNSDKVNYIQGSVKCNVRCIFLYFNFWVKDPISIWVFVQFLLIHWANAKMAPCFASGHKCIFTMCMFCWVLLLLDIVGVDAGM